MQPRGRGAGSPKSDGWDHTFGDGIATGGGADEEIGDRQFPRGAVLVDGDGLAQDSDRA